MNFSDRALASDEHLLHEIRENSVVCVEADNTLETCTLMRETVNDMIFEDVSLGSHLARLVIVPYDVLGFKAGSAAKVLASSALIEFSVVDDAEFHRQVRDLNHLHEPQDLLT